MILEDLNVIDCNVLSFLRGFLSEMSESVIF